MMQEIDNDRAKMPALGLLRTLKEEKLVPGWKRTGQKRAAVRQAIEMQPEDVPGL